MFLLIILILILLLVNYIICRKLFSPGVIFNGIYFITLFLYSFYLSDLQQILSNRTILLLSVSVIFFNIPVILLALNNKYSIGTRKFKPKRYKYKVPRQSVLIALVILFFIVQVVYSKGFPLLWKITGSDKTYFDFGIPSITGLYYGFIIVLGAWSLFKKKNVLRFVCLFIAVLIISRQVIISIVLEGIIYKFLILRKNKWKFYRIIIVLGIVGIVAFSVIGNFRTGEADFLRVAKFKEEYDWVPTSFKWIYSYMCFSLSNLNNLVGMTNGGVNYGTSMFNELTPTVLSNALNIKENFSRSFLVSPNFTVSTYLPPIYLDFGILGVGVFCFLLGLGSQALFNYMRRKRSMCAFLIYCVIMHNIILLFFTNMFLYLPIIVQIVYVPIIFRRKKYRKKVLVTNIDAQLNIGVL